MTATIGDDLLGVTERINGLLSGFTFNHDEVISPAESEHRDYPRAHEHLLVKINDNHHMIEGVSNDFSLSGIQLRLNAPMSEKENIKLNLTQLPPSLYLLRIHTQEGQVFHERVIKH